MVLKHLITSSFLQAEILLMYMKQKYIEDSQLYRYKRKCRKLGWTLTAMQATSEAL
jgi:hypothetical protein